MQQWPIGCVILMDEELIRKIMQKHLEVYEVRDPKVTEERYRRRDEAIEWAIGELRQEPIKGGTQADVPYDSYHTFGNASEWIAMHDAVFIRDGNKCRICGGPAEEVHHIRPRFLKGHNHPRNLISLCRNCHDEVHRRIDEGIRQALEDSLDFSPKKENSLEGFM